MTPQTLAAADPAMVRRWLATPQTVRQADYLKLCILVDDPTLDPELRADLLDVLPLYREAANIPDDSVNSPPHTLTTPVNYSKLRT